jgi:Regulator of ribonuclease activity B
MMRKELLVDLFERSRKHRDNGQAPFNIDEVCRWSYFFADSDVDKLIRVGKFFEELGSGYEVIEILESDPDNTKPATSWLRVDRIEKHTVKSLHALNKVLDDIAARFGVICDGMEVGAIGGP